MRLIIVLDVAFVVGLILTDNGNSRIRSNIDVDFLKDNPFFGVAEGHVGQLQQRRGYLLCFRESEDCSISRTEANIKAVTLA